MKEKDYTVKGGHCFEQELSYTCGPSSIRNVLYLMGMPDVEEGHIAELACTTIDKGTEYYGMVYAIGMLGLVGRIIGNTHVENLNRHINKGSQAIVDYMSGPNHNGDGHYSVFVGGNKANVVLADPADGLFKVVDRKWFDRQWFDFNSEGERFDKYAIIVRKK